MNKWTKLSIEYANQRFYLDDLAQAINCLKAYNLEVGLLINFGTKSLEFKRLINSKFNRKISRFIV